MSQKEAKRDQKGTPTGKKSEARGPNESPEALKLEPKGFQKRKEKVTNREAPIVEKLKNHKNKQGLKSENVDVSLILQQKLITPKKFENK